MSAGAAGEGTGTGKGAGVGEGGVKASKGFGFGFEVGIVRVCQPGILKSERLARVEGRAKARG